MLLPGDIPGREQAHARVRGPQPPVERAGHTALHAGGGRLLAVRFKGKSDQTGKKPV